MTLIAPTGAAWRLVRGGVAGGATGALALAAHVEAHGSVPGPGLVALPVVLLVAVAAGLGGRERSPAQILVLVGVGQLVLHLLMSFDNAASHGHGAQPVDSVPLMVVAHALATLVVVAVLAGAERAVFAVAAALASVLPRKVNAAPVPGPLRTVAAGTTWLPKAEAVRCDGSTRRGPPVFR